MEPKEFKKDLEELSDIFKEANLKHVIYITDKKTSLLIGKFNKTDVKNMLFGLLKDLERSDRTEILNDVSKVII